MIPGTYYVPDTYQPAEIYTYVRGGTHDTYVPPVDAHVWRQLHLSAVARCSDSYCCILLIKIENTHQGIILYLLQEDKF